MKKAQQLPVWVAFHWEHFDPIASVGAEDVLESVELTLSEWLGAERREWLCHDQKGRRMRTRVARMKARTRPRKSKMVSRMRLGGIGLTVLKIPVEQHFLH